MKHLQVENRKEKVKKAVFKTWITGFVADFMGGFFMLMTNLVEIHGDTTFGKWWYENLMNPVMYNSFETVAAFLWTTMCVAVTAILIYFLNKTWCLKNTELNEEQKKKVSIALAVFTAPYLFYLPTAWFW